MGRRAKSPRGKAEAERRPARRLPKNDGLRVIELKKRLAEALKREADALEQQTAASEILRVISQSPTDPQPVFDTIAANASRLCGGIAAIVTRFDGEMIHLVAHQNPRPGILPATARLYPRRPSRDSTTGRAILECSIVHIPDAEKDPDLAPPPATCAPVGSLRYRCWGTAGRSARYPFPARSRARSRRARSSC